MRDLTACEIIKINGGITDPNTLFTIVSASAILGSILAGSFFAYECAYSGILSEYGEYGQLTGALIGGLGGGYLGFKLGGAIGTGIMAFSVIS